MKKLHEKTILRIISDAIIVERTAAGIQYILRAFDNTKGQRYEPEEHYYGLENAFELLGINQEESLTENIYMVFAQYLSDNEGEAFELAKGFYVEILSMVSSYYTNKDKTPDLWKV